MPDRLRALGLMAQELDQTPILTPMLGDENMPTTNPVPTNVVAPTLTVLLEEAVQLAQMQLLPRIQRYRMQIVTIDQLSEGQRSWLWQYFQRQIYPLLTPFVIDSSHPFPPIQTRRLNFLLVLQSNPTIARSKERYGLVHVPARLPRLIQAQPYSTPSEAPKCAKPMRCFVWLEEIVRQFLPVLFSGASIKAVYQFRLLHIPLDNGYATLAAVPQQPAHGQEVITRLDVEKAMPLALRQWLIKHLHITPDQVLACPTPLALADLCELADLLTLQ